MLQKFRLPSNRGHNKLPPQSQAMPGFFLMRPQLSRIMLVMEEVGNGAYSTPFLNVYGKMIAFPSAAPA